MAKFHIGRSGKPAQCRAKKGNCPFGSDAEHYGSRQEAQKALENKNSSITLESKKKQPEKFDGSQTIEISKVEMVSEKNKDNIVGTERKSIYKDKDGNILGEAESLTKAGKGGVSVTSYVKGLATHSHDGKFSIELEKPFMDFDIALSTLENARQTVDIGYRDAKGGIINFSRENHDTRKLTLEYTDSNGNNVKETIDEVTLSAPNKIGKVYAPVSKEINGDTTEFENKRNEEMQSINNQVIESMMNSSNQTGELLAYKGKLREGRFEYQTNKYGKQQKVFIDKHGNTFNVSNAKNPETAAKNNAKKNISIVEVPGVNGQVTVDYSHKNGTTETGLPKPKFNYRTSSTDVIERAKELGLFDNEQS